MKEKKNILEFIPQRPPFVMVDELLFSDESQTGSVFTVPEDNLMVKGGKFQEPGLLENIAQTAAARAGYTAVENNEPVKLGYIGAVKNFQVFELPPVHAKLLTTVTVTNQIFDVTAITGTVSFENRIIASCEMKIFIINPK